MVLNPCKQGKREGGEERKKQKRNEMKRFLLSQGGQHELRMQASQEAGEDEAWSFPRSFRGQQLFLHLDSISVRLALTF